MLTAIRRLKSPNFTDKFFAVLFYVAVVFITCLPLMLYFFHKEMPFLVIGFMLITAFFLLSVLNSYADFNVKHKDGPILDLSEKVNPAVISHFSRILIFCQRDVWWNGVLFMVVFNAPYIIACFLTENTYYPLILSFYAMLNFCLFSVLNESSINREIVGLEIFKEIDKMNSLSQNDKNIFKQALFEGMQKEDRFTRISFHSYVLSMNKYIQEKWDRERKSKDSVEGKIFQYKFKEEK